MIMLQIFPSCDYMYHPCIQIIYAPHLGYALIQLPEALMSMYMRLKGNHAKVSLLNNKEANKEVRTSNEINDTRKGSLRSSTMIRKSRLGFVNGYKQRKRKRNPNLDKFIAKTVY